MIDWSVRNIGDPKKLGAKAQDTNPEYIKTLYESERNLRPVLELARSPIFDDLLLTVHDFYFCIWKVSIGYTLPIFRSPYTLGAHNTGGAFSPTRAGVVFITKSNGIDVWDFLDQSHKPSLSLLQISSSITTLVFQGIRQEDNSQVLAFGEQNSGSFLLYRVPPNLKNPQFNENE